MQTKYLFQLSLQIQDSVVSGLPEWMWHSGGHMVVPKSQSITCYHAHWQYGIAWHSGGDVGGAGSDNPTAAAPWTIGHPLSPNGGHCPTAFWEVVSGHGNLIVTKVHRAWSGIGGIERLDIFHGERLAPCSPRTTPTATSAVGATVPHPGRAGKARWTTRSLAACTSSISSSTMVGIPSANRTGTTIHRLLKEWSPQQLWSMSLSLWIDIVLFCFLLLCPIVEGTTVRYVEMLGTTFMINILINVQCHGQKIFIFNWSYSLQQWDINLQAKQKISTLLTQQSHAKASWLVKLLHWQGIASYFRLETALKHSNVKALSRLLIICCNGWYGVFFS